MLSSLQSKNHILQLKATEEHARKLVPLASDGADDGIMKQSPMLDRVMFSELVSADIAFQNCP